jgi:hypothetical protein
MTAEMAAPKRGVKIFALWRHGLEEARTLALEYLRGGPEPQQHVVLARLVNDKPLALEEVAALLQEGIRLVPLSSRYRDADDSALQKAVMARLKTADRLLRLAQDIRPPEVDAAAARAVKEAYAKLPRVTPLQRQEFLDEYYAADQSDNSVS